MIKKIEAQTLLAHRSSSFLRFLPHHPNSTHRKREKSVEISQIFFDQRRRRRRSRRKRIKRRCCPQSRKGARSPLHLELTPCSLSTSVELSRSLSLSLSLSLTLSNFHSLFGSDFHANRISNYHRID